MSRNDFPDPIDQSHAYRQAIDMTDKAKRAVNPPKAGGGRPGLPKAANDRVHELIEEILSREPFVGRGGITRLSTALDISQPALTQIRGGGGVSADTAIRVAKLANVDPRALLGGAYVGIAVGGKYPNLDICLAYHRDRWMESTVAAVRAGIYRDDVDPEVWRTRLDTVQASLSAIAAKERS